MKFPVFKTCSIRLPNLKNNKWREEWGEILGERSDYRPAYIDYPIVEVIEWEKEGTTIPALALPALLVKLDAPDDVILRQVKEALKQWRKKHPFSVSPSGRKAPNAIFDETTFAVWRSHKIVQLGELIAWREGLRVGGQKTFPNAALGSWLDFDDKKTSKAFKLLKRALEEDLRALNAQVVFESGGDKVAID